MTIHETQGADC